MAEPEPVPDLEKENRVLQRRLGRLEANYRQLEELQDSNATVMSRLVDELEAERAKSQRLLLNVLPERIVGRLESGEAPIADRHGDVTVLFGDFVDFTRISAELAPTILVDELNQLFRRFDEICDDTGVEKIKTVGDAYLAVGGISGGASDGARSIAEAAVRMVEAVEAGGAWHTDWRIRIGLHHGPLVAGVVGASKFAYDVWGDTVNVASRLESTSEPNRIHVSAVLAAILDDEFRLEARGALELKGVGLAETFFLLGRAQGR